MNDAAKQLLLAQGQLQRSIIRAVDNLKKLGRANVTPATLRSRISTIKDNWARFFLDHSELLRLVDETTQATTPYFKNNVFDEVEDAYQAALDYMNESLESLEPPVVSLNHSGSDNASLRSQPNLALSHLPPISLPPFNGSLDQWEHFRDRFTALIIQNRELKDFARMHYLLSCLTGSALECVRELPVTAENFDVAWKALSTRFENKRRLIRGHLSTLLNLPSITKESASDLQGLIDKVSASLTALKNLNRRSRDLWHDMLVYIISQRLDNSTRKAWSMRISDSDTLPTTTELLDFLRSRQRALDDGVVTSSRPTGVKNVPHKVNVATASTRSVSAPALDAAVAATPLRGRSAPSNVGSVSICPICQSRHFFSSCPSFVKGNSSQRRNLAQVHNRCFNCLSGNHGVRDCNSKFTCRKCHQRHHTMLHGENSAGSSSASPPEPSNSDAAATPSQNAEITALVASRASPQRPTTVLLATAWISVSSSSGRQLRVRALIDQGSEMTFVSESVAKLLKLKRIRFPISVAAVGGSNVGTYNFVGNISISPVDRQVPSIDRLAVIMPTLTSYAPRGNAGILSLPHLLNIQLADFNPASSKPIDVILGADIYNEIILDGLKKGAPTQPIAQNTIFGWIVSGPIDSRIGDAADQKEPLANVTVHLTVTHNSESLDLANALERFWQTEEPPAHRDSSREDNECEAHFINTHSRQTDGRYVVRIPFKTPPPIDIGSSKAKALSCLKSLLRRFQSNPAQAAEYRAFMTEYESLGHMRIATLSSSQEVFIPHHPVYRLDSATSRIRVVFNASSLTSNGSSLNEHMYSGPKLQSDLPTVILRWRLFRYVCTADIAKMYRQILVAESDIDYQRILWSPGSTDAIREYQLLTVTYGTACAPFLALRVLQQLSLDDGHNFPFARDILRDHIYVDDVLFGAHSVSLLVEKRDQLIELLSRGRFTLRKWASNSSKLLADINPADHGLACNPIPLLDEQLKILGVHWLPHSDEFRFRVSLDESAPTTKREILSTIAKFYDPMGWGTPTIICAKILIQRLWKLKAAWDELVPPSILTRWQKIYSSLSQLNSLHVPRWIGVESDSASIELHGFADASSDAYAAVVYARVISSCGTVTTSLLVGKSKVAPLKLLSIPRLELSAAVLLAKLIEFVRGVLPKAISCTCWTDSSIVLAWLKQPPSHWKTFVANRVADIQNRLANVSWRHVVTKDNPADCASRGLLGSDLLNHPLWWHGPPWLKLSSEQWPSSLATVPPTAPLERKLTALTASVASEHFDLAERFSSWPKLIRVTAYLFRFIALCRRKFNLRQTERGSSVITADECAIAKLFWLKYIQSAVFSHELHALSQNKPLSVKSSISALNVFLDRDGLIRVGGRLRHAPLAFSIRHPIVLAPHGLVKLITSHAHLRSMHAGLQLTLNTLRREYWILRARSLVRFVVHKCVTCVRERAVSPSQLMGDLPRYRVSAPARCFLHCGLDYAGPFFVRASGGRGIKSTKCYISLFVCLATRAVHLELVSDYSTPAFLNAFSRFCARRGCPKNVYSDNGTTFVGADRELTVAYRNSVRDPNFQSRNASDQISWHFIPPSAPHFGGLWEAGVKSVKYHLRRVLGAHTLTFEEFSTLLCRVEACLNSRPIAPLSDSCDSFDVLTPGHFLIGSALTAPPEESKLDLAENRLSRWQLIHHMTERLWSLWYADYVNTLQQRAKWRRVLPALRVGQLVILKNSALPPCKWELGRVVECFPGPDGLTRVASIRTAHSEYKRPLSKLCVLPIDVETTAA